MGIAWDSDFDRCFLFDERGDFVEGYYLVGLFAEHFLAGEPGGRILHDPRLIWNTQQRVAQAGGQCIPCPCGHAIIKQRMRAEKAIYGGEMSAHHYFRDFSYCDSGMIPWLLMLHILKNRKAPLSELVAQPRREFPVSGEINRRCSDIAGLFRQITDRYAGQALELDDLDGIGMNFADWRFNLRASNTEALVRLNVETRGDPDLLRQRTGELLSAMAALGCDPA